MSSTWGWPKPPATVPLCVAIHELWDRNCRQSCTPDRPGVAVAESHMWWPGIDTETECVKELAVLLNHPKHFSLSGHCLQLHSWGTMMILPELSKAICSCWLWTPTPKGLRFTSRIPPLLLRPDRGWERNSVTMASLNSLLVIMVCQVSLKVCTIPPRLAGKVCKPLTQLGRDLDLQHLVLHSQAITAHSFH